MTQLHKGGFTLEEQKQGENHIQSQFALTRKKSQSESSPSRHHQQRRSTVVGIDTDKQQRSNELTSKNQSEGLVKESSGRLKAMRPDLRVIASRIHSRNLPDLLTPFTPGSTNKVPTTVSTPGFVRSNQIPTDTTELAKPPSKKKIAFGKEVPLTMLAQKLFGNERDNSFVSPKVVAVHALTAREATVEEELDISAELRKEEIMRRSREPTVKDLQSFYPKARTKAKSWQKANLDDSKLDREAVEDLNRWDSENKQSSLSNIVVV